MRNEKVVVSYSKSHSGSIRTEPSSGQDDGNSKPTVTKVSHTRPLPNRENKAIFKDRKHRSVTRRASKLASLSIPEAFPEEDVRAPLSLDPFAVNADLPRDTSIGTTGSSPDSIESTTDDKDPLDFGYDGPNSLLHSYDITSALYFSDGSQDYIH